jgi:hypothetical protein
LQLQQYIATPLSSNAASPSGFRIDVNNVDIDPNHPVQVDSHSFDTRTQHREVMASGPVFATLPAFQTPVVNPAYGQCASPDGVLADAAQISSISVRDVTHLPAAPLPIAGDNSLQHPLFDPSFGSYAPDGVIAYNSRDGFANSFTSHEAQPVYHFSESGPPPFDLSFTHRTTADQQNLWLADHDPGSVTGHQDAQTLVTLGFGLERSFVRPNFLHVLG